MKCLLSLICCSVILVLSLEVVHGEDKKYLDVERGIRKLSSEIKAKKITIVKFLPLPLKLSNNMVPHERVFTNEFYSQEPTSKKFDGIFIPNNYLDIINDNLKVLNYRHKLKIEIVDSVATIPADSDYILFGAVQEFYVDNKQAKVSLNIQLLKGINLECITNKVFSKSLDKTRNTRPSYLRVSLRPTHQGVNKPLHMIGDHKDNFHEDRSLLNIATYMSLVKIIKLINEVSRY